MNALEVLKTRRSVRRFRNVAVEREKIEEIIDCARLAPSAVNVQPWEFVVVTEGKKREDLARFTDYGKFLREAPVVIAVFCKETKYYLEDGCAATENILLAAWALGLGSCWVAGDKKPYAETIRKYLQVPDGYRLVSLVALGYPEVVPTGPSLKRSLHDVLHWEKF